MQASRPTLNAESLLPHTEDNAIKLDVIDVYTSSIGEAGHEANQLQSTTSRFRINNTAIRRTIDMKSFLRDSEKPKTRIMYIFSFSLNVGIIAALTRFFPADPYVPKTLCALFKLRKRVWRFS